MNTKLIVWGSVLICALVAALIMSVQYGRAQFVRADVAEARADQWKDVANQLGERVRRQNREAYARTEEIKKLRADKATSDKGVRDALEDNSAWSGSRIPDGVYDALPGPKSAARPTPR